MRAVIAGLSSLLALGACGPTLDPADFVSSEELPFDSVPAEVLDLDGEAVGALLTEARLRFELSQRRWTALPLDELQQLPQCLSEQTESATALTFTMDVPCRYGSAGEATAGEIHVDFRVTSSGEDSLEIEYVDVQRGELEVDGLETSLDIAGDPPTSEITVDLVQNGFTMDYSVTITVVEDVPFFDYILDRPEGPVLVRLTNPQSMGAFAAALVVGLDGSLECEIRNDDWEPGEAVKGTCTSGLDFGL